MRTPTFTGPLETRRIGKQCWELMSCFGYVSAHNKLIAVPVGRRTNAATIPKALQWIYRPSDFMEAATIHDDLVLEAHDDWPAGTVFDANQEAVKLFAQDMHRLDLHIFEAMAHALAEYTYRVDSRRAHDIMIEAMWCPPCQHNRVRRWIIRAALRVGGPRWDV